MQLFANNALSALAADIAAGASALTLAPGSGAKFPSPANGDFFLLTLFQLSNGNEINHEIVKCTARAGDVCQVQRAQEGTAARAYVAGDAVSLRLTAGSMQTISAGNGMRWLATLSPGSAAYVDALQIFTPEYDNYLLMGTGLAPAADDSLCLQVANGGVLDVTGQFYYQTVYQWGQETPSSRIAVGAVTRQAGRGLNFILQIMNANDATHLKMIDTRAISQHMTAPNTGVYTNGNLSAYLGPALSGFRLFWNGGSNFNGGNIRLYAHKN